MMCLYDDVLHGMLFISANRQIWRKVQRKNNSSNYTEATVSYNFGSTASLL
jgi:hypothetical protein